VYFAGVTIVFYKLGTSDYSFPMSAKFDLSWTCSFIHACMHACSVHCIAGAEPVTEDESKAFPTLIELLIS
jgi:hypothetical protein